MRFCLYTFRFTSLSFNMEKGFGFSTFLFQLSHLLDQSFCFSLFILWAPFLSFNFQHVYDFLRPSSGHTALPPSLCSKASKINLLFINSPGKNYSVFEKLSGLISSSTAGS